MQAFFQSIWQQFEFNIIEGDRYKMLLDGLGVTVTVAICAAIFGALLGSAIALMRLSKLRIGNWYPLRWLATVYVDVIRGTPMVVQLMIMYYIIMATYDGSKVVVAIISFSLNSGAYVSEIVRGGILAVDKGQTEAGRSLGMSSASTMLLIVMPQAIKVIMPSLFNEFIMLIKETSIVGYIALMDLAKAGDYIRSRTFSAFFPLLTVAAIYLIMVIGLSRVFAKIEKGVRSGDQR